jgi:peptidoglycan/xylan/chitin deacetylase (PgdA/CDA1 family)
MTARNGRRVLKRLLARTSSAGLAGRGFGQAAGGATLLIYHRVGGGSPDERDVATADFVEQLDEVGAVLPPGSVVPLDTAADRIESGNATPSVVLTFDDGFADVYRNAWPHLRERRLPFTIYVASGYVGATMRWEGSTAKAAGPALTWDQLAEMLASGLCTVGNHTRSHARPEALTATELDLCSADIERHLQVQPRHFAYTWGIAVPAMEPALRERFRTAATGRLGRNQPGADLMRLRRVPVRRTDPAEFFRAKLVGALGPERAYAGIVAAAKKAGARA